MPPFTRTDNLSPAMRDELAQILSLVSDLPKWSCAAEDGSSDFDALVKSMKLDRQGVVELLLEKGSRAIKQGNALHMTITRMGWSSVVEKLLALGAKASDQNSHGDTALHLAFNNGVMDGTVDLLLDKYFGETKANVENNDGLSFLHIACTRTNLELVRQIIDRGVDDINCQVLRSHSKYAGYSPLHFAVQFGRHEIATLLLRNSASIYCQDLNGSTPIHLALYNADQQMIDRLFAHDQRSWNCVNNSGLTHFMAACAGSVTHVVEEFLHERPMPSQLVDSQVQNSIGHPYAGYSPIHFATEFGNLGTVQVLLEYGASWFATTVEKWSPMSLARSTGRQDILLVLEKYSVRKDGIFGADKVGGACVDYKFKL